MTNCKVIEDFSLLITSMNTLLFYHYPLFLSSVASFLSNPHYKCQNKQFRKYE